ncbi:MAG: hypothetical protein ACI93R_004095 [Flavobacteriales bacterium]|jgi:hypothetical protein
MSNCAGRSLLRASQVFTGQLSVGTKTAWLLLESTYRIVIAWNGQKERACRYRIVSQNAYSLVNQGAHSTKAL